MYKNFLKNSAKNNSILDLGCNKGYLLKILEEEGYVHLTGVDLSQEDLIIAKKVLPGATFIEDDIFHFLKYTNEKYDIIFLKAVIEHIEKSRVIELLQLISKRLSDSGFVIIDVYNADWL